MNEKTKSILKNFNYTVTANFLVLGISVILNLVVPKYLNVTEYGFWQLYIFFSGYVAFFHFGWIDGIYLKIGGEEYQNLNKSSLGTQFYYLFILQLILATALLIYVFFFISDINRKIILGATACTLVITNIKSLILFIFQSTNRIKEYAQLSRNDRYFYLVGAVCYLLLGGRSFVILIVLDVLSKLIITLWGCSRIKDIIFCKREKLSTIILEIKDNIKIGSNLMLGHIASMLILGVSRFFVEDNWNIEMFGKLSFSLSISSMFMLFIGAISVVLYPTLRRENQENLPNLYIHIRELLVPLTLSLLVFFYPLRVILEWWLPTFNESMFFMGILFPIVVYEGRTSLLINTYLKTIRQEKIILVSNLITLLVSTLLSLISVYMFNNIYLTVISITISLAFRCIIAEIMLTKRLKIKTGVNNVMESILILTFIVCNLFFENTISLYIYISLFIVYILLRITKIRISFKYFINSMKIS